MPRALFSDSLTDRKGNALSGVTVNVYNEGTTTPISDTIYSSRTEATTLANPFTITAANRGEVRFWLDVSKERVDVRYSGSGIVTKTVTLDGISPDDLSAGAGSHPDLATHDALGLATDAELTTHAADTTAVHGIGATSGLRVLKSFTYIAQGTVLYTLPVGITAIFVECIGAGGGGGGGATAANSAAAGGGGGGGGYASKWITSPAASYTVGVGAGGAGGAAGNNAGSNGGTTTFGSPSVCTATGGNLAQGMAAGTAATCGNSENGGIGTVGDLLLQGNPGVAGFRISGTASKAGDGGSAARGGGGARGTGSSFAAAGETGGSHGGGGSGGCVANGSAAAAGGAGADGRIIVYEYGPA